MKFIILVLLIVLPFYAMAVVPGGETRAAGAPISFSTWAQNIGSSGWVEFKSSMQYGCSAVQVQNTGSGVVKLGIGSPLAEVDTGLMFPAGSAATVVGMRIRKGDRLAIKTDQGTQTAGFLTLSCLQ